MLCIFPRLIQSCGLFCTLQQKLWKLHLTGKEHGVLLQRFADMISLPSQRAFIYLQVITLDQDTISWEKVTWWKRTWGGEWLWDDRNTEKDTFSNSARGEEQRLIWWLWRQISPVALGHPTRRPHSRHHKQQHSDSCKPVKHESWAMLCVLEDWQSHMIDHNRWWIQWGTGFWGLIKKKKPKGSGGKTLLYKCHHIHKTQIWQNPNPSYCGYK